MKVQLRNVIFYGHEPGDDGGFTADFFIRGRMVGRAHHPGPGADCYYQIVSDPKAQELYRQLCAHLESTPAIITMGSVLKDAFLRHQVVEKEFTAPRYRVAWMRDCLAKYDARMMRFRVLRLKMPISQLQTMEHGKDLLRTVAISLLLHDLQPGDYLVNNHLPSDVMRQVTTYQLNILSSIFTPIRLVKPTRQKGRRPP